MQITATQLRQNVYKILDDIFEKGTQVEIKRKGAVFKLTFDQTASKLKNLKKRKVLTSSPSDIIHMDWSTEWRK